jgi:hypothetical protein
MEISATWRCKRCVLIRAGKRALAAGLICTCVAGAFSAAADGEVSEDDLDRMASQQTLSLTVVGSTAGTGPETGPIIMTTEGETPNPAYFMYLEKYLRQLPGDFDSLDLRQKETDES